MHYFTHTFPNGLRLIHLPAESPVAYCGFVVNAGTRDEEANEFGLAHFVEHMLFKGTEKRRAWYILNRMENVGGELNAYTTKEETFVYSVFLEEHFGRAFELLTDILFHSCFPPKEIEKEIDVILDEINTYKDNPSDLIFDEFENLLFQGHALGHNILGDEESVRHFTSDSGLSFTRRFYVPSNIVFFSMGRTKPAKIVRLAEKNRHIASFASSVYCNRRTPPLPLSPQNKCMQRATHQTHVMMGGRSYGMYESDKKHIPLFLLNNLLGGAGMNSRLNLSLREKHGLVYNVESSVGSYTDTGLASIYFGTDPRNVEKSVCLVRKELKKLCDAKLSALQLTAVKKQAIGQLGVAVDHREGIFLNLGKHFLHHNRYESPSELFKKIENTTAADVLEAANEVFSPANLSSLIYE
jgi:predicted Zn-dependent peptidase